MIKKYKNFIFGTSEMTDGGMRLDGDLSAVNRQRYFDKISLNRIPIVSAGLTNSNVVKLVDNKDKNSVIRGADALITNENNLILSITTADCLPIYFFEPSTRITSIAHAGWRGLLDGIISNTIRTMKEKYEAKTEEIKIFIGPHINKCHFAVKDDVYNLFKDYPTARFDKGEKKYIDLGLVAISQAVKAGVMKNNIEISKECTYCLGEKYFSFRRDGVLKTMINFIVYKK